MRRTMRMVRGPYSGQTIRAPAPVFRRDDDGCYRGPVPYLVNVWSGEKLHCYLTVQNSHCSEWRLVYQDSF
jgi:hypothetical protein